MPRTNSVLLISTLLSGLVFGFAAKLLARACRQSEYVLTKITPAQCKNPDRNGGIHETQTKPHCGNERMPRLELNAAAPADFLT